MALNGGSMKKTVLLKGPLLTRSGYGEQARFALRSLRSRPDQFEIFIQPLQWGKTSWLNDINDERRWIDQTIEKTIGYIQQGGKFDISIQVTIPNEFQNLATTNIGYTAGIETTKVSHQWIQKANEMDKVIVVSSHSKQVFENTEYQVEHKQTGQRAVLKAKGPIEYVGYPVKTFDTLPDLELQFDTDFNFLSVAQFGPRKNLPNMVKWFVDEFRNENVGLILKSNIAKNCLIDRNRLHADLSSFMKELGEHKCKVFLLHGDMTDEEMHSLYKNKQINALVSLPHGEGFGLPLFEAAYSGLPVVSVGWSGQLDFLVDENKKERFYSVAFDIAKIQESAQWEGVLEADSMWAYARENSAKEQMRACYENNSRNDEYAEELKQRFSEEKMYNRFVEIVLENDEVTDDEIEALFASLE